MSKPLPAGMPQPPEGMVYLGKGYEFEPVNGERIDGAATVQHMGKWVEGLWEGNNQEMHYAAKADSEVVKHNEQQEVAV